MKEWLKKRADFNHDNVLRELETSSPLNYKLYEYSLLLSVKYWKWLVHLLKEKTQSDAQHCLWHKNFQTCSSFYHTHISNCLQHLKTDHTVKIFLQHSLLHILYRVWAPLRRHTAQGNSLYRCFSDTFVYRNRFQTEVFHGTPPQFLSWEKERKKRKKR
jgi:hypothetical protein